MNLIDAIYDTNSRSKFWLNLALVCGLLIYLFGIWNLIFSEAGFAKVAPLLTAIIQLFAFFCKYRSGKLFSLAEKIRRTNMLKEGLGRTPSSIEIAQLTAKLGRMDFKKSQHIGDYYSTKLEEGPKRLLEMTQESAFWSGRLADSSATFYLGASIFGLLVAAVSLFSLIIFKAELTSIEKAARIVLASILFWVVGDSATMWQKFNSLESSADQILQRVTTMLASQNSKDLLEDSLLAFSDYCAAVGQAPPIPEFIYDRKKELLDKAWKARALS
jgi:hypothetical protein